MRRIRKWGGLGSQVALALLAALAFFAAPSPVKADPPRRSLELELDEVPGSTGYQLRVTKLLADGTKKKPVYFKLTTTKWSAKLLPGKYTLEFRSFDSRHVPGPWSAPQEFSVKLPAADLVSPADKGRVVSDENDADKVEFSWKPVEDAEKYKLRVMKPDGSLVEERYETGTATKVKLPVAAEYKWTVTPYMAGGLEGDTNEPAATFELVGAPLDRPKILPVDDINTSQFEWSAPDFAKKYQFTLEMEQKDGTWKNLSNVVSMTVKESLKKPLLSGRYRLKVVALGDHRQPSEAATSEFKTLYVNSRSPAAIEQVKSEGSYETKSTVFGLASYFVTFVNYSGANSDVKYYNTSYQAIGGTGRLGVGTWFSEDSKLGVMTVADLSGYTILGQTSTYFSQSVQGVYRERLGAVGQLRINFGAEYRDLPVTLSTNPSSAAGAPTFQSNLSTVGPLLGVTVAHAFTRKLGMQFNFQVMDSTFGIATPNQQGNVPDFSYQVGILGSMKLGPKLVGFMGYSYRDERATYTSAPSGGAAGVNTADISGHYLNLLMEYGF